MTPGEKALETLITNATHALQMTGDPLMARAQQSLIALRTPAQVQRMEQAKGIAPRDIFRGRRHG